MTDVRFKEIQRFNQIWLWMIIIITGIPLYYVIYRQLIVNDHLAPNSLYLTVFILHLLITILLLVAKLDVEISSRHISYQFFPFHLKRKKVPFSQLQCAYIREYSPLKEMSALGIKLGQHSKVYNIRGFLGLQIEFLGGRQLMLGTQKPEELDAVLTELQIPEE